MLIAGVDEAGRGPIAGAVFAAAVILDPEDLIKGLDDSKKLSERRRNSLEIEIKSRALSWAVAQVGVEEIDRINILQAALLAMRKAVERLDICPEHVRADGNYVLQTTMSCEAVIGGDAIYEEISAASILAKQARDREMIELGTHYPGYGFERHKGYPTRQHIVAMKNLGVTIHHRKSFRPVKDLGVL